MIVESLLGNYLRSLIFFLRIPLRAWMFVLYVVSYVGRGLCDGLITRPEESYLVSNWVCLRNLNTEEDKAQRGL
jgi:hypothetical protein